MLYNWFLRIYHTIAFIISLGIFIHVFTPILVEASPLPTVFINELHYDNSGADQDEFIELAGLAGINLSGWSLHFYNGSNGTDYKNYTFSDLTIDDSSNGFGFASVHIAGIQNGSPDGIVLADSDDNIIQFISYEGSFTATRGIAEGLFSSDIGVVEASNTPIGYSLQLSGNGERYQDFTWTTPQYNSLNTTNNSQVFIHNIESALPINEPNSILLILISICLIILSLSVKKRHYMLKI